LYDPLWILASRLGVLEHLRLSAMVVDRADGKEEDYVNGRTWASANPSDPRIG
jgi:hypothetical protein